MLESGASAAAPGLAEGLWAAFEAAMFTPAFTLWGAPTLWLEVIAFGLALAMVFGNIRVRPWAWPLAIASSLLYLWLFFHHRLYGDGALQGFFALVALWGWWQWVRGTLPGGGELRVRRMSARQRWAVVAAVAVTWPLLGLYLARATDTDVPWWDAFPTAASVVGQFLLARQWIENWAVWIVVNTVSIGLFAYKHLWLTALLYMLFVGLSVAGWRAWARRLPLPDAAPTAAR